MPRPPIRPATNLVLEEVVRVLRACIDRGGKILICGNGGSAAEASHFAAELVVRYKKDRPAIAAISLSADCAVITACANDYGYDRVFARQIEALGRPGDVLVTLSTSGKSANVLRAIEQARSQHIEVVEAPRDAWPTTAENQEHHLWWIHSICRRLDE